MQNSESITANLSPKKSKKKTKGSNTSSEMKKEKKEKLGFHQMGIDDRILMGVADMGWSEPTMVQQHAIPLMLTGKSVMAQARTGSGKTGAFLVPLMHRVLCSKSTASSQCTRMLVLAPSKELCQQIGKMASRLAVGCSREVRILDLSPQLPVEHQRPLLAELPDVVVGPPRRVLSHMLAGNLCVKNIESLVIDEADLMMAYQHNDSLKQIWDRVPEMCQYFITSATLSSSLVTINKLLFSGEDDERLKNALVLRLKESPLPPTTHLSQYVMKVEEFEKMLVLFSLFKLKKIMGKTIVFVNTINKGYKLRMVLGQFGIATCLLNSELPWASRCDIISQFNSGHYNTIIATDDAAALGMKTKNNVNLKGVNSDIESGTSRGLDFQSVSNIINFDFPPDVTSYIHRVGRTARGTCEGTALSMVCVAEHNNYVSVAACLKNMMNKGAGKKASRTNAEGVFQTYDLDMKLLEDFEYRVKDVWSSCGEGLIRQARRKEIAFQLLNSKKLMVYFQDNPGDKSLLKHDKRAHGLKTQNHLRNLPVYMKGGKLRDVGPATKRSADVSGSSKKRKFNNWKGADSSADTNLTSTQKKYKVKKSDPLKSMEFNGF